MISKHRSLPLAVNIYRKEAFLMTAILLMLSTSFLFAQQNNHKTSTADTITRNASNITFLLDISNSMGQDNKMLLLKKSTEELLKLLNKKDRISLISFGNTVNTLYNTSSYSGPDSLINIITKIRSRASATNINGGLFDAYELSMKNLVKSGINQILLITDGEFELNNFSRELVKSNKNIVLTCVIIGKGLAAEQAIRYITEELKLKVITLVDEEKDVKRLAEIIENQ